MKTKKVNPRNKRLFHGPKKAKRGINVEGTWKAVELDPSLFAEEGMEGLVCFEELTDYRMLDSDKLAAEVTKEPEKNKKGKKRKSAGGDETLVKEHVETKEADETVEPATKKAKTKSKSKAKKDNGKESDPPDGNSEQEIQGGVSGDEAAGENQTAQEEGEKYIKSTNSDPDAFTKPSKKSKNKRKSQKKQSENDTVTLESSNCESNSELQAVVKGKMPKPLKKQQQKKKNWTEAVLDSCNDKKSNVSAWKDLFVPSPVLKALSSLGFGSPTPIQALTLPSAIRDHMDILGAAETGRKIFFFLLSFLFICLIKFSYMLSSQEVVRLWLLPSL